MVTSLLALCFDWLCFNIEPRKRVFTTHPGTKKSIFSLLDYHAKKESIFGDLKWNVNAYKMACDGPLTDQEIINVRREVMKLSNETKKTRLKNSPRIFLEKQLLLWLANILISDLYEPIAIQSLYNQLHTFKIERWKTFTPHLPSHYLRASQSK